ncbi:MAG: hypothetical protein ACRDNS_16835, partial [Trebonia sp.]
MNGHDNSTDDLQLVFDAADLPARQHDIDARSRRARCPGRRVPCSPPTRGGSRVGEPATAGGTRSLIIQVDLSHPIILGPDGRVMDGMHRIARALLEGLPAINAV